MLISQKYPKGHWDRMDTFPSRDGFGQLSAGVHPGVGGEGWRGCTKIGLCTEITDFFAYFGLILRCSISAK